MVVHLTKKEIAAAVRLYVETQTGLTAKTVYVWGANSADVAVIPAEIIA